MDEAKSNSKCCAQDSLEIFPASPCAEENVLNSFPETWDDHVVQTKVMRVNLDRLAKVIQASRRESPERDEALKKIIEAKMWLGMDLGAQRVESPYPDSYDPSNTNIAPATDVAESVEGTVV